MSKAKEMEKDKEKDGVITDKRFVHLHSDPRFVRLPKNNLKVSIDSRFQRMFSDTNFSEALAFDKRGRPLKKKHKSKLLEYYYHLDQDEENENEENANTHAPRDNGDKIIIHSDGEINDEMELLQSEKKNKKKKRDKKNHIVVNGNNQGHGVFEGDDDALEIQMKKTDALLQKTGTQSNKKHTQLREKYKKRDETMYVDGVEDNEETQLKKTKKKKKKNEMNHALVDANEILHKEEGNIKSEGVGTMNVKKKKKSKVSSGLDKNLFIDQTQDDNRFILPKKNKKQTKVNTDTDDLEGDMYKGKDDGDARVQEEEGLKASKKSKRKLKKMKDEKNGENLSVTDKLNFFNEWTETNNEDEEDQGEKQYSLFGEGKKKNATLEALQKQHGISDDGGESSESQSSSDEYLVMSDSEESETSSSSDDNYQIDMPESPKEEVPTVNSETRRLAAVNMDWNHIKAVDLLVLMNSLLPKGGRILSVRVYPSEFGLQQMVEEAVHGPALFGSDDESSEDDEDELDNEKLRQYEKARLRYYFAVIECDSSATADYLYKTCDGVEFERTSNTMDLRFIPDDMEFNHPPRDVATEVPSGYEAPDFHTRALQHSKVNISWDDDEPLRVKTLHRKYDPKKLNEMDFKDYLASDDEVSDSDEDNEDENVASDKNKKKGLREKYRSLLLESGEPSEGGEDKDDKDMEITFNTGLEELSKRILEKSKKNNSEETVWEAYLRKRKEKKKARKKMAKTSSEDESESSGREDIGSEHQDDESDDFFLDENSLDNGEKIGLTGSMLEKSGKKQLKLKSLSRLTKGDEDASKAELELLLADENILENGVRGYNLKPKKLKGRKRKEYPSEDKLPTVDNDDPRFSALFTSHHFAIDPTDPQFKRSASYSRSIVQKQQKNLADETTNDLKSIVQEKHKTDESKLDDSSNKKRKTELSSLIKSVKRKVGTLQS